MDLILLVTIGRNGKLAGVAEPAQRPISRPLTYMRGEVHVSSQAQLHATVALMSHANGRVGRLLG